MNIRPYEASDEAAIRSFVCSSLERGQGYASEVHGLVRRKLVGSLRNTPSMECFVAVDDGAGVVGVVAFEPHAEPIDEVLSGAEPAERLGWWIHLLAVRLDWQGSGLGRKLLVTILNDLATRTPDGFAMWKVDARNEPSKALCARVGAEPDPAPTSSRFLVYFVDF